ncbi:adenosylcobinamide amidohydrolase [uncultured Methanomethylovorans sp.]|uniref:adenosylcobinamide amidohydrolase n=1 Tax=uncultured Methanomethylovorans sp. TaxID=183759 RepID=UPI002AA6FD26|nr:adenosylcobinamide amidohydrolase [uncultured Methanomethylovorans sp.]
MTEQNIAQVSVQCETEQDQLTERNKKVLLYETSSGERVFRQDTSIVVQLPEGRSTLTSSWLNGGYREDLKYIFNHQVRHSHGDSHDSDSLKGGSIPAFVSYVSEQLGLDSDFSTGLLTAANMDHVCISNRCHRDVEVTAIITGGVEVNGGRAGDPASYHQENGKYIFGTINTILLIGANLPSHTMVKAALTAAEAKTVALQQLMAPSRYSEGIATGSGTDMIAIVADRTSPHTLTDAGKHSKLGEMIGRCVIEATQKALAKQSELTPESQCDMLVRLERFGINEEHYWKKASEMEGENRKARFLTSLRNLSKNPLLVGSTTSVLHILDEISWGLLPEKAGKRAAITIMRGLPEALGAANIPQMSGLLREKESILDNWVRITAWLAKNGMCADT